ncbi:MAG TPA: hypothetical protein VKZ73_10445 [Microbacterium sp.]|nr:hypothetical protein [Microbacterium sp.]
MRRLTLLVPVLSVGLLAGCSQITQAAGEAVGIPVGEICSTADDAYSQYQALLEQGDATEEQVDQARDDLVATLEGVADEVGGEIGDLIGQNADRLADATNLQAPETIEAVEQARDSVQTFCG